MRYEKIRYVSIDVEMTGLDIENCDVIEFGAVVDDLSIQEDIAMLPTFHCYFVKDKYLGEPYALSMHPTIFRRIADREEGYNYYNAMKFGNHFKQWLAKTCGYKIEKDRVKINAAGKNFGSFDLPFLRKHTDLLKHVGIRNRILDPSIMFLERGDPVIPGLEKCKIRAGLDGFVDHTAVADAIDVVNLVRESLGPIFK